MVAQHLTALYAELAKVGERDAAFPLPHGRGVEFHHGSSTPDAWDSPPKGLHPRERDLHPDTPRVQTCDVR